MTVVRTLWHAALDAADEVLAGVYRFPVGKALDPQNPADFLVLQHRLATALKGLTGKAEADAMRAALNALDVDWASMTAAGREKIILAARGILAKPPPNLPAVGATFQAVGTRTVLGAKTSFKETFGAKISVNLSATDARVVAHAANAQAHYVRDQYGVRADAVSANARKIVSEGLAQGLGRYELAKDLRDGLAAQGVARSDAYWNMAAGVFVNRSRVYGNLSGYADAKITRYRIDAVLDEVTTLQCRFLNGRIFEVGQALGRYAAVAASPDPEEVRTLQPWMGVGKNDDGELALHYKDGAGAKVHVATVTQNALGRLDDVGHYANALDDAALARAGLMTPPFHGNCRTTTRPVFGGAATGAPPPFTLTSPRGHAAPVAPPPRALLPVSDAQKALVFGPGGLTQSPIHMYAEQQALLFGDSPGIVPKPLVVQSAKGLLADALEKILAMQPDFAPGPGASLTLPLDAKGNAVLPYPKPTPAKVNATKVNVKKPPVAIPLNNLILPVPHVKGAEIVTALKTVAGPPPVVIKFSGKYYLHHAADAPHVMAQQFLGSSTVDAKVIDLDIVAKVKKPKPSAPFTWDAVAPHSPEKPAPIAVPVLVPATPARAPLWAPTQQEVMVRKVPGPSGGSNQGETYEGVDGVKRFVKIYKSPGQAYGEHLANRFYRDLGLGAPESVVFNHKDGAGYGSALLEGETLGSAGLTKERAQEFMRGFIADVLTGNWDAAGQSMDNAFVAKNGKVMRIDNGGAFLFRAQGGPKPDAALGAISEWEVFFSSQNASYRKIAAMAGHTSADAESFKGEVTRQIQDVLKLRENVGGWKAYVNETAPGLAAAERAKMVEMLETRTGLLEGKLKELVKPKPVFSKPDGFFETTTEGTKAVPGKVLKLDDLAERVLPGYDKSKSSNNVPDVLPSGESLESYRKRAAASMAKVDEEGISSIVSFSGNSSSSVRDYEERLAREGAETEALMRHRGKAHSDAITRAFTTAVHEPGTTYRGLDNIAPDVVHAMLNPPGESFGLGRGNVGATTSSSWNVNVAVNKFANGLEPPTYSDTMKVILQIHAKTAIPIETISTFGKDKPTKNNECERMLGRDARYRVVSAARWRGKARVVIIEIEEVD